MTLGEIIQREVTLDATAGSQTKVVASFGEGEYLIEECMIHSSTTLDAQPARIYYTWTQADGTLSAFYLADGLQSAFTHVRIEYPRKIKGPGLVYAQVYNLAATTNKCRIAYRKLAT